MPHTIRRELFRVVGVDVAARDRTGSGYAISDALVLTAEHVVGDTTEVLVRTVDGTRLPGWVLWRGVGTALVQVSRAAWADAADDRVYFGEPAGPRPLPAVAYGYPNVAATRPLRGLEPLTGLILPGSETDSGHYSFDLTTSAPIGPEVDSGPLGGMSGAAVLAEPGRQVVGVVVADSRRHRHDRLRVVPAAAMLDDPEFRRIAAVDAKAFARLNTAELSTLDSHVARIYQDEPEPWTEQHLLPPEFGAAPLIGRTAEVNALRAWCRRTRRFDTALLTGRGGTGKSRLAAELCELQTEEGWAAGLLSGDLPDTGPAVPWPTLVVCDYVDEDYHRTARLARRLAAVRSGQRIRLLLLARRPMPWWPDFVTETKGAVYDETTVKLSLDDVPIPEPGRRSLVEAAIRSFATKLGRPPAPAPDLDPQLDTPLLISMVAVLVLAGEWPVRGDSVVSDRVLDAILHRERVRWRPFMSAVGLDADAPVTADIVAYVSELGPARAELAAVLKDHELLRDRSALDLRQISDCLADLLTGPDGKVAVRPDLLAEHLVRLARSTAAPVSLAPARPAPAPPSAARQRRFAAEVRRQERERTDRARTLAAAAPDNLAAPDNPDQPVDADLRSAVARVARVPVLLAIEADLRGGATVYRHRWDDGLPGREGGTHICAAWLIEAYLRTGRRADAEELFDQMLDCTGPTGLLPEQYDPEVERGLGNHPHAYSHLGLIRCALLLDSA